MQRLKLRKLILEVHESLEDLALETLDKLGVCGALIQSGRSVQLGFTGGLRSLLGKNEYLHENPLVLVSCFVPVSREDDIMHSLAIACSLGLPGRGSLASIESELICPEALAGAIHELEIAPKPLVEKTDGLTVLRDLVGINCIVQRGNGNELAHVALDLGTCVPSVTFGEGTGLRDKLGLLRITIAAAKELVHIIVPDHDAQGIMSTLIEEAKLNQPGRGFISTYPIKKAILNTRIHIGRQTHAASIEQIIGAIDSITNNTLWRRRFDDRELAGGARFPYFRNMTDLICISDEGTSSVLTRAAMDAGATGATTTKLTYHSFGEEGYLSGDPTKERTTMVLPAAKVEKVVEALLAAGVSDDGGMIELVESPISYTYQAKVQTARA